MDIKKPSLLKQLLDHESEFAQWLVPRANYFRSLTWILGIVFAAIVVAINYVSQNDQIQSVFLEIVAPPLLAVIVPTSLAVTRLRILLSASTLTIQKAKWI